MQAKQDTKVRGSNFPFCEKFDWAEVFFRARPGGESECRSTDRPLGSGSMSDLEEEVRWWGLRGNDSDGCSSRALPTATRHPTSNILWRRQAAIQDSDSSKGHPGIAILNFASSPPKIQASFATALPLHPPSSQTFALSPPWRRLLSSA